VASDELDEVEAIAFEVGGEDLSDGSDDRANGQVRGTEEVE
jgi:hypothetical protein